MTPWVLTLLFVTGVNAASMVVDAESRAVPEDGTELFQTSTRVMPKSGGVEAGMHSPGLSEVADEALLQEDDEDNAASEEIPGAPSGTDSSFNEDDRIALMARVVALERLAAEQSTQLGRFNRALRQLGVKPPLTPRKEVALVSEDAASAPSEARVTALEENLAARRTALQEIAQGLTNAKAAKASRAAEPCVC